ncbi:MAG: nitroreductase family protein [bacterium]
MMEQITLKKTILDVIEQRKSIRNFTNEKLLIEDVNNIIKSAIYAPYGGATGIALKEIRKIFIFTRETGKLKKAQELIYSDIRKSAKAIKFLSFFMRKMKPFSKRLNTLSKAGIPALDEASCFIVIAEKKGFPSIEKQSIAHAMQNMWLAATSMNIGFSLISATGMMVKNKEFVNLLGLPYGEYEIDGCVIGIPKSIQVRKREINTDDFVTWI